jgi:hypothetical protein
MPTAMPPSSKPAATDITPAGRYHVAHYGKGRNFALYEGKNLLAVTMYKKGAETVQHELEARDTVIAEQAARIEQLMAAARPPGPEQSIPAPTRYRDRVRHGQEQQLGFFSSEQKEHFTAERRDSSRGRS